MVSDFELPWQVNTPVGKYESTTTIDMVAYSAMIRQRGREAERAAIAAWLRAIEGDDGRMAACRHWAGIFAELIKNAEYVNEGEKA
jgi:hypothetical protein